MNLENHKTKAAAISFFAYVLFLGVLFFMSISYTPEAEFVAMGVDLNYGVDIVGYGDNQTLNEANQSSVNEEMAPSVDENVSPKLTTTPQKTKVQPKTIKSPTTLQKETQKNVITSEVDKTPKASNTTSSTKSQPSTPSIEKSSSQSSTPQRSVDEGSIFKKKGTSSNSNGTVGTKSGVGGNNNGDGKPGDVGDQGSPEGTLDGKSLYGKPGAGGTGGASVSISGWRKKSISIPTDKSNETGRIVFEVTVNDLGSLTRIQTLQSNVSPSVVKFYEDYLKRNLSNYLIPEGTPPPNSKGRITINITSGN